MGGPPTPLVVAEVRRRSCFRCKLMTFGLLLIGGGLAVLSSRTPLLWVGIALFVLALILAFYCPTLCDPPNDD